MGISENVVAEVIDKLLNQLRNKINCLLKRFGRSNRTDWVGMYFAAQGLQLWYNVPEHVWFEIDTTCTDQQLIDYHLQNYRWKCFFSL